MASKINAIYSIPYEGNPSVSNGDFKGNHILSISGSLSGSKSGSGDVKTLDYGMNVFEYVENENDYYYLPSPGKTGDSIYLVNNGNDLLAAEQSETNQVLLIPPDGVSYRTTAIGGGVWTPIIAATLINFTSYELIVNHTSGSITNYHIGLRAVSSSGAPSANVVNNTLNLGSPTPYWGTVRNKNAWATKLTVTSNVSSSDLASVYLNDAIQCPVWTVYMPNTSSVNITSIAYIVLNDPTTGFYECSASILANAYAGNIGDNGTLYGSAPTVMTYYPTAGARAACGIGRRVLALNGGEASDHYFSFGVYIPASAATKTYKFQYYLEGFTT